MKSPNNTKIATIDNFRCAVDRMKESKKIARDVFQTVEYLGTNENLSFTPQIASVALQNDAYACSEFVKALRKAERKGEPVILTNLDDCTILVQRPESAFLFSGISFNTSLQLGAGAPLHSLPSSVSEELEELEGNEYVQKYYDGVLTPDELTAAIGEKAAKTILNGVTA